LGIDDCFVWDFGIDIVIFDLGFYFVFDVDVLVMFVVGVGWLSDVDWWC